jgi:hypothetical protein
MDAAQVRQLVEQRLQEAQQSKVYKDFGRVSGTAKERRALGFITVTVVEEQERTLEELADLVKKDKVLPKFDPQAEKANGNSAGASYFRYQVLRNWIPKPAVKHRAVFAVYVEALTQFNAVTERDTDLATALQAFLALFANTRYNDGVPTGTMAQRMGDLATIEGLGISTRYEYRGGEAKQYAERTAGMIAVMGKQLASRATSQTFDYYGEALQYEAVDVATSEAKQAKVRREVEEARVQIRASLKMAQEAKDIDELKASNVRMNMWLDEVVKEGRKSKANLQEMRKVFTDHFERRLEAMDNGEKAGLERSQPKDEDWTWTVKYFGRPKPVKTIDAGGIQVNVYPNLADLERRNGIVVDRQVTPAQLASNWGLKAVQYGNSLSDGESSRLTYWANASFMDLSDLLRINVLKLNQAMGLGLDLATRGRKGSVATYHPTYKVINLNRQGGDGSLAHEWAHALDHWMGIRRNGEGFLTESTPKENSAARESERAVAAIMQFIHGTNYTDPVTVKAGDRNYYQFPPIDLDIKPEQFYRDLVRKWSARYRVTRIEQEKMAAQVAKAYGVESITVDMDSSGSDQYLGSKKMGKPYWIHRVELFARAFEGYLMDLMDRQNMASDYLQASRKFANKFGVYPSERDLVVLRGLFPELIAALRSEQDATFTLEALPVAWQGNFPSNEPPRESFIEANTAPSAKAEQSGEQLADEQEREAQGEAPTTEAKPQVAEVVVQSFVPLDDEPGWGADFYDDVRDEVERMGEMTTSDAQGVISAWVLRQRREGKQDYQDQSSASTTARAILGIPTQEPAPAPEAQPQVEQVVADPPAADPEPEPVAEWRTGARGPYLGPVSITTNDAGSGYLESKERLKGYGTEQLLQNEAQLVKASFGAVFGGAAKKELKLVREELQARQKPVPEPAQAPAPPSPPAPKAGQLGKLVQNMVQSLNIAIQGRLELHPDEAGAEPWTFSMGTMQTGATYFDKAKKNVEAIHVMNYGPHALYLHHDYYRGYNDDQPGTELDTYTVTTYGVTYGIESKAGQRNKTKTSTLEVLQEILQDITTRWPREQFNGIIKKAHEKLNGPEAVDVWTVRGFDEKQLKGKRGQCKVYLARGDEQLTLQFNRLRGTITCEVRQWTGKGDVELKLPAEHPVEHFTTERPKYAQEFVNDMATGLIGINEQGVPMLTEAFTKKWGPLPQVEDYDLDDYRNRGKYTPAQLGFAPNSQRWLKREADVTVETDAVVMVFNGADITKKIKSREALRSEVNSRMVNSVIGSARKEPLYNLKPVGLHRYNHFMERQPEVVLVSLVQNGVVLLNTMHVDLFGELYGYGLEFKTSNVGPPAGAVMVYKNGKELGLIMPVQGNGDITRHALAKAKGVPVKQLEDEELRQQDAIPVPEPLPPPPAPEPVPPPAAPPAAPPVPPAPMDDDPGWGADFYEDVRDAVERLGEMTTSDAQGVISAWVIKQRREGKQDYKDQGSAETTAREILGMNKDEPKPVQPYMLGDRYGDTFDYDGMLAMFERAKAGTLDRYELEQLHDSLEDVNYHEQASLVWNMLDELDNPKLTASEQLELDLQQRLGDMFYGTKNLLGDAAVPLVGQRMWMGLDLVDVKPNHIVMARPGSTSGIGVLRGRERDMYELFPRIAKAAGYGDNYKPSDKEPRMMFVAARWDEGFVMDTWELELRTSWPTLSEAVAAVYGAGGTLDIFAQELEEVAALPAEEIKARKRPEGKPPSPQQWRKVKAKLKGMARQADGEDMDSLRETALRIQALRGYYGQVDEASRNKRTRPLTKKTLVSWAKAPGRMDLEGIDTPR